MKWYAWHDGSFLSGRSREGAWIEIAIQLGLMHTADSRSREGAWIEIAEFDAASAPAPGRSREGAWIEILS